VVYRERLDITVSIHHFDLAIMRSRHWAAFLIGVSSIDDARAFGCSLLVTIGVGVGEFSHRK